MNVEDALIGKMLGMRYQIIEKIGSGGMAVVYKAKCHMLNRFVAVKVLKPELKNDIEIVAKFKAESQAAASLSHHNIVSVYDVGEEDGISYIVMEYVEGITLKKYIEKKGMIPWREACAIAVQICDAIEQAHRNNIIHNDIKPHNILMAENNTVKVTDFGIARAMSGISADTMVVSRSAIGSVYYMSPEQDKGRFTDARSDIYSIGIVLYEMLAGRVPFDGDNHVMISLKKIEEDPVDVRIYNPDIPERISFIVMKAISRESHARYQTAEDMSRELTRATSKNYDAYDAVGIDNKDLSNTRKVKPINDVNIRNELLKGTKEEHKKRKKYDKSSAVIAIITTIVIIAIAFGTYIFMTGGKKEIVTPSLLGLTLEEAQEKIKDKDFTIEEPVLTKSSEESEMGKIILQDPGANASVKAGTKIVVTIGTGPEAKTGDIEIPSFDDLSYTAALKIINEKGLKAVKIEEDSESINEGFVIRQSPAEGTMVTKDAVVTLYISKGKKIRVPSIEGMTQEKAEEELKKYDLNVGSIKTEESNAADGVVIGQSPEEGAQVEKNSKVNIIVSGNAAATQIPEADVNSQGTTIYKPKVNAGNNAAQNGVSDGNDINKATQRPVSATKAPVQNSETHSNSDNTQSQTNNNNNSSNNNNNSNNSNSTEKNEEKTKTLTVSFNDSVGETVKVRVEANGREIHNETHKKSEGGIQIPVKGTRDAEVKIYFDDQLVTTKTISFD